MIFNKLMYLTLIHNKNILVIFIRF